MKQRIWIAATLAAAVVAASSGRADVKPHALFTDGMVLQRGMKCPIWGSAAPGEKISVKFEAKKENTATKSIASATADDKGKWRVEIQVGAEMTGGPHEMVIEANNTITITNVYVGEVWVCSGQSNMEWPLSRTHNAKESIKNAENANIRLFTVPKNPSDKPLTGFKGQPKWQECNPDTVKGFSAIGYFFGRDLHKELKVPIGLIHTSWGGTRAEAWTSRPILEAHEEWKNESVNYHKAVEQYNEAVKKAKESREKTPKNPTHANAPSALYNGMIAPLVPYAIKGAIWYQGEANAGKAYAYRKLFPTMIQNWRADWKQGDFPFLFVQLAPWRAIVTEPRESDWAELREAQLLTSLHCKNTGMAVITDVGDPRDIHPRKKEPVGARLALAARALGYGEKIEYSGPVYDKLTKKDGKIVLHFTHVGKGLKAKDGPLHGFTIAGADNTFHNAKAEIQGETILVWADAVTDPVAVRYGWANCPVVNLWNKDGLPASPFRTDDFPGLTAPKKKRPAR